MKEYASLVVSLALGIVGFVAAFNTLAGAITLGQGMIITLFSMAVLVLLNIQIRLEELVDGGR